MDESTQRLIEQIHTSPTMAVIAVAGAGSAAVQWLLGVPGTSRTLLEVLIPYSPASLAELLGHEPEQAVSARTANEMARAAYHRAVRLRPDTVPVAGISCTAAIATDRPKRGGHRCHVATWTSEGSRTHSLYLKKGLRQREEEERIVSSLVLHSLAEVSRAGASLPLPLHPTEHVDSDGVTYEDPISALLAEHIGSVTVETDGTMIADARVGGALLPGSFNPLHDAHQKLARVASKLLDSPVLFELSVANVDKPTLQESETRARIAQFAGRSPVVVTRAPVFHEKAAHFPGCTFVIGWDTAVRLADPRYYRSSESAMISALEDIRRAGCGFLVAGRERDGIFKTLDDVEVPAGFADMFTAIPESSFRYDLSSSELRAAGRAG
jgi:nicotinamide mononucleotide (NMN) deamidase PncC